MITAIVKYKLPGHIGKEACRAHFQAIAPGFLQAAGLLEKRFIWSESGWAGGVYLWQDEASARRFYSGSWLAGIQERYGMTPEIEYFEVFGVTNTSDGQVRMFSGQ